jgi:hypothetical protein
MGAFLALACLPCLAFPCIPTECKCTRLLSRRKRLLKSHYLGNMIYDLWQDRPCFPSNPPKHCGFSVKPETKKGLKGPVGSSYRQGRAHHVVNNR